MVMEVQRDLGFQAAVKQDLRLIMLLLRGPFRLDLPENVVVHRANDEVCRCLAACMLHPWIHMNTLQSDATMA
jgi:hypothetical protein